MTWPGVTVPQGRFACVRLATASGCQCFHAGPDHGRVCAVRQATRRLAALLQESLCGSAHHALMLLCCTERRTWVYQQNGER